MGTSRSPERSSRSKRSHKSSRHRSRSRDSSHRSRRASHSRSRLSRSPTYSRGPASKSSRHRSRTHRSPSRSSRKHRQRNVSPSAPREHHNDRSKSPPNFDVAKSTPPLQNTAGDTRIPNAPPVFYSSVDNPFHDANLEAKFVWRKKKAVDRQRGISSQERERLDQQRRAEAAEELEKLNQRRIQREQEIQQREADRDLMQRQAEAAALGDWESREEEFHLTQAKKRAEIRIKEQRAKPVDVLAMNLRLAREDVPTEEEVDIEVDVNEPFTICDGLPLADAKELSEDIKYYLSLEKDPYNVEFWQALVVVCEDKIRQGESGGSSSAFAELTSNIAQMIQGKTRDQLVVLERQIEQKLASHEPLDVDYWEQVLGMLRVNKAKARLSEMHQELLLKRLAQLREKQQREALRERDDLEAEVDIAHEFGDVVPGETTGAAPELAEDTLVSIPVPPMSPKLIPQAPSTTDSSVPVLSAAEAMKELEQHRLTVIRQQFITKRKWDNQGNLDNETQDMSTLLYRAEAAKGVSVNEEVYSVEANLRNVTYLWQDKYRPRKPRYFNRVHTGYEWNKFNQTHYDVDNPPPKIVQGYKFNIFYPDLIDKTVAPTYKIEPDPDSDETVILRFSAGPPYEDIAFRIINKQWERSHRRGFRNIFDRGILKLYFRFKRHYYRR
ncbi:hypothetical protein IWQ62_002172 [Dispira parvispora]|uniref:Splicing factor Cactin n=1 Tax=Dispira parvispora TaxID=1520584 RepID=A0A9W8AW95_9FUNG|nr:hypothetical protein IWQ62_002172 [Dispira parvispora]